MMTNPVIHSRVLIVKAVNVRAVPVPGKDNVVVLNRYEINDA